MAPCEVVVTKEMDEALAERLPRRGKIGFSDEKSPYGRVKKWLESGLDLSPSSDPIAKAREIKEPSEVIWMRQAAQVALEGVRYIENFLKPGISEKEMAAALEIFWLTKGEYHPSFSPIIGFGESTAYPHHHPTHRRFDGSKSVQLDIGVQVESYQSDLSRYYLSSESDQLKEIYQIVKEAQQIALTALKPGVPLCELDKMARDVIEKSGYGEHFPHSLGHSIGLEVHESPFIRSNTPKEVVALPGMCMTIEPGIYIPGVGGVRLEETVLVTQNGSEVITR
jgi:Xaa-Pro aminopeptidase